MLQQLTDKALVKRYQHHDLDAFTELARRHHQRLYRLAAVQLIDASSADDVTQEVFMRALKGFKSFLFLAEPSTWLYRTTKNVCREFNRRKPAQVEDEEEYATGLPEEALASQRTIGQVRRLVKQLPERQRDVVMLRIFEELSVEQTATIMNCRPGTVKALLHKAMQTLRKNADNVELLQ